MVEQQDKLLEVFGEKFECRNRDGIEELVMPDETGTREFAYRYFKDDTVEHMDLLWRVKDGRGVWCSVVTYTQWLTEKELRHHFKVACLDDVNGNQIYYFDPLVFYDHDGSREAGLWSMRTRGSVFNSEFRRMLFPASQVPKKLDVDLTAELFRDQVIGGDFGRPVLVPVLGLG